MLLKMTPMWPVPKRARAKRPLAKSLTRKKRTDGIIQRGDTRVRSRFEGIYGLTSELLRCTLQEFSFTCPITYPTVHMEVAVTN